MPDEISRGIVTRSVGLSSGNDLSMLLWSMRDPKLRMGEVKSRDKFDLFLPTFNRAQQAL